MSLSVPSRHRYAAPAGPGAGPSWISIRSAGASAAVREAAGRTETARAGTSLDALERSAIAGRHDGNIAQAAAALGLSRPPLYRRMAKHGV
jgi:transcriptional regulator of acetoin/glycerol metabolism